MVEVVMVFMMAVVVMPMVVVGVLVNVATTTPNYNPTKTIINTTTLI